MKRFASIAALLVLASAVCFGQAQWQVSDAAAPLGLGDTNSGCSIALTTGVYAANPASSGAFVGPAVVRAQAQNTVLQATTTAAASALTLTCDLIPASFRTTPGKGISITGVQVNYGVQTTALSSVTSPNTFSTVTYPSVNGSASGTVAAIAGTAVFNPVLASAQVATTTSGQCYTQLVTPASPILVNNANQRVVFEEVFNQVAGTAAVYQICGVTVFYNNIVF